MVNEVYTAPRVIGLTGGIGSGKTTVSRIFQALGYPVFSADKAGHKAYFIPEVKAAVIDVFGEHVYNLDGSVNRKAIAASVFKSNEKLNRLNEIIHPAVKVLFSEWLQNLSNTEFVFREAAILFESGSHSDCAAVITVSAPEIARIARVQQRDAASVDQVKARLSKQMTDEERRALADYEIVNDGESAVIPQITRILDTLTSQFGGR
jgi:dephospho-CoA kinase